MAPLAPPGYAYGYIEARGTCLGKLSVIPPQNIFAKLSQIIFCWVAIFRRGALQVPCVATNRDERIYIFYIFQIRSTRFISLLT